MEQCEGKVGGICGKPAIWKQTVTADNRPGGRVLMSSFWCDQHAETIIQKRRRDWQTPPLMARLVPETVPEALPEPS